jgi:hypothetical protein
VTAEPELSLLACCTTESARPAPPVVVTRTATEARSASTQIHSARDPAPKKKHIQYGFSGQVSNVTMMGQPKPGLISAVCVGLWPRWASARRTPRLSSSPFVY